MSTELRRREAAGWRHRFQPGDFYADALPCLERLRNAGYRVGLAGNQPVEVVASLEEAGVHADFVAASALWLVEKPSPAFFAKVCDSAGFPPEHIAYVGDRLENDVSPARAFAMTAVYLHRGPWVFLNGDAPDTTRLMCGSKLWTNCRKHFSTCPLKAARALPPRSTRPTSGGRQPSVDSPGGRV